MDRRKVKSDFGGVSDDLLHVRKKISRQIKRENRAIKEMETQVKRRKIGVRRLLKQKAVIERTIINVSGIRNSLAFITNEKVPRPTWSSTTEESDGESSNEESEKSVSYAVTHP